MQKRYIAHLLMPNGETFAAPIYAENAAEASSRAEERSKELGASSVQRVLIESGDELRKGMSTLDLSKINASGGKDN